MVKRLKTLAKALPAIAAALASQLKVKLRIMGHDAYTDGRMIVIPSIRLSDMTAGVKALGYLAHEAFHILLTDFTVKRGDSQLEKDLENVFEDCRIERSGMKRYPGTARWLKKLTEVLVEEGQFQAPREDTPPGGVLLSMCLHRGRFDYVGQEALETLADESEKACRAVFGDKLADQVLAAMQRIPNLRSTQDAVDLAAEVYGLVKDQAEAPVNSAGANGAQQEQDSSSESGASGAGGSDQQSDQDQQQGSSDGSGQSSSDPSEGAGSEQSDNDAGTQGSDDAGDGEDEEGQAGGEEPEKGSSGPDESCDDESGADADGSGDADANDRDNEPGQGGGTGQTDDAASDGSPSGGSGDGGNADQNGSANADGSDSADGEAGNSDPTGEVDGDKDEGEQAVTESQRDAAREALEDRHDPVRELAEIVARAVERHADPGAADAVVMAGEGSGAGHGCGRIQPGEVEQDARQATGAIRAKLRRLLQSDDLLESTQTKRTGKRLARGRLPRVAVNDGRVFKRRVYQETTRTAVHILQDNSGSMGGEEPLYWKAAFSTALGIEELPGADVASSAFPDQQSWADIHPITKRKERVRATASRYNLRASGGTPMAEAMWTAACELQRCEHERKLLIVITDGGANNPEMVKEIIERCSGSGIEVIAIGIHIDIDPGLFPVSATIRKLEDLPDAVFSLYRQVHQGWRNAA